MGKKHKIAKNALDALLFNEYEALSSSSNGDKNAEILPYNKHNPFYKLIISIGRSIDEKCFEKLQNQDESTLSDFRPCFSAFYQPCFKVVSLNFEQKYGIFVEKKDFDFYLVGLGKRIIEYAELNIQPILNQAKNLQTVISETDSVNKVAIDLRYIINFNKLVSNEAVREKIFELSVPL
jgi:hypothetical protein